MLRGARSGGSPFVSVVFLTVVVLFGVACGGGETEEQLVDAPAEYNYLIPVGYGALVDTGEASEIFPASLDVVVGEDIEIINEDDRGHIVGPFFVGAGETVRYTFAIPGTYSGACTLHESGETVLIVHEEPST